MSFTFVVTYGSNHGYSITNWGVPRITTMVSFLKWPPVRKAFLLASHDQQGCVTIVLSVLAVRIPPQTPTRRPRKPQTAPIWTSNPVNMRRAPKLNHVQNIENPMLCWPREMGWGHDGFYWAWKIRLCGSFLGDHWWNEKNKGKNWCGSRIGWVASQFSECLESLFECSV